MSFFTKYPRLAYTLDTGTTYNVVTDVLKRVSVNPKTKENLTIFDEYDIKDGETPEIVSFKFYNTSDYHWVILLTNDIFDARFGWPLTGEQLFRYVQDKYGEANVAGVHHYTLNENSDIVVDPTQTTTVKTLKKVNFPENVATLFSYASNGTIDTNLSSSEQAFVSFLQQPSPKVLPIPILRGDSDHNGVVSFGSSDGLLQASLLREIAPDPDGPGPLSVFESFNQHLVYYLVKPAVDDGNAPILASIAVSTSPSANILAYYKNGLYYYPGRDFATNTTSTTSLLGSYMNEVAQTNYQWGDITGTTRLSGIQYGSPSTDAAIAQAFRNGTYTQANVHFANIITLLSNMLTDSDVVPIITSNLTSMSEVIGNLVYTQSSTTSLYPYAYPVTNLAYEEEKNEAKRRIRILRAEFLNAFVTEFEKLVNA